MLFKNCFQAGFALCHQFELSRFGRFINLGVRCAFLHLFAQLRQFLLLFCLKFHAFKKQLGIQGTVYFGRTKNVLYLGTQSKTLIQIH